jgi:hypothetical protein
MTSKEVKAMARSDTRYSVYPTPKAVELIGNSAPALNQAIECWAALLARATADNNRTFEQADLALMQFEQRLCMMNEWWLIAEAIKHMRFDPEFAYPGHVLASAVEDANKLDYIGNKCLDWGHADSSVIKDKHVDVLVNKAIDKLRNLDYVHAWAVIVAIQWLWAHHEFGIDLKEDRWWTPGFRRDWKPKQIPGQERSPDQEQGARTRRQTKKRK